MKFGRPHLLDVVLLLLGLVMVGASGFLAGWTADWAQAALLTVGAAVLLGVVLRWAASVVRDATEAATVAATQATEAATAATHEATEAREHAETAAVIRDRMRADITTMDERLRELLDPDGRHVVITARAAATSGTPSTLAAAIRQAREDGTLGGPHPMVQLRGADDFWVRVRPADTGVAVQVGRRRKPLDLPWLDLADDDLEAGLVELGRQVQRHAPQFTPEPLALFGDVAELLELGASHEHRFGLFARWKEWGAAAVPAAMVVSLGPDREPPVAVKAIRNSIDPLTRAPRDLDPARRQQFAIAQQIALEPDAWFETPKKRN